MGHSIWKDPPQISIYSLWGVFPEAVKTPQVPVGLSLWRHLRSIVYAKNDLSFNTFVKCVVERNRYAFLFQDFFSRSEICWIRYKKMFHCVSIVVLQLWWRLKTVWLSSCLYIVSINRGLSCGEVVEQQTFSLDYVGFSPLESIWNTNKLWYF